MVGLTIFLPLYYEIVHKFSASDSGLALIPIVVMSTPGSILAGSRGFIAQATRLAMSDVSLQASYRAQGMEPDSDSSPDKFQRIVEATSASLAPVIKSIGLSNL